MIEESNKKVLSPRIHPSVFIAEGARIYGDVEIKEGASVWFNAVIRGDEGRVTIGENTNIQDNVVIHSDNGAAVQIGNNVTVGHCAVIRGARIGDGASIGMNATIMSYSRIGADSVVGANTFVPYNKQFSERSMIVGLPGRVVRMLETEELKSNQIPLDIYRELVEAYRSGKITGLSGNENGRQK
jgi:carbonic anhydrase/acetyltransferase-like protein (isoleucine patch superfamily)